MNHINNKDKRVERINNKINQLTFLLRNWAKLQLLDGRK